MLGQTQLYSKTKPKLSNNAKNAQPKARTQMKIVNNIAHHERPKFDILKLRIELAMQH